MKVIIAGSREIRDWSIVSTAIQASPFHGQIKEVVSGRAPGVDASAEALARLHNIPVKEFPADWDTHGRAAGPIRNREMARYADALIAVWDGKSKGTKNMVETMKAMGKPTFIYLYSKPLPSEW